jgi:hypothetical protein
MHSKTPLAAVVLVALASASWDAEPKSAPDPAKEAAAAPYVHCVVFRLKKDAPKDEADTIVADCHDLLEKIPTVRVLKVGRPAAEDKSSGKVATRDYDVALMILFDDFTGLKTYIDHEKHLKFVENHGKYFEMEKLQVFDFQDEKK